MISSGSSWLLQQTLNPCHALVPGCTGATCLPTWHDPDFTCNFPQTVLRPTETDQIYPKPLLCFDSHLLVNISRCSSQHLSVISSKHCLCLQFELRPTGTPVRLKNPDYLGLKTQTKYMTTVSKMPDGFLFVMHMFQENTR